MFQPLVVEVILSLQTMLVFSIGLMKITSVKVLVSIVLS